MATNETKPPHVLIIGAGMSIEGQLQSAIADMAQQGRVDS